MDGLDSGFYIEHTKNSGWFLFDYELNNGILHLTWSTKVENCKYWTSREEVERLLNYSEGLCNRAHIVDLTKENGYNGYFK